MIITAKTLVIIIKKIVFLFKEKEKGVSNKYLKTLFSSNNKTKLK